MAKYMAWVLPDYTLNNVQEAITYFEEKHGYRPQAALVPVGTELDINVSVEENRFIQPKHIYLGPIKEYSGVTD